MTTKKGKKMTTAKKSGATRPVVICTAKSGVFYGLTSESVDAVIARGNATITSARMCTYWSAATKGVLGLASVGPQPGSKIGPRVPSLTMAEITAIMVCTPEAAAAWESGQWS